MINDSQQLLFATNAEVAAPPAPVVDGAHVSFLRAYAASLAASGAQEAFAAAPTFENAEALTMAMYDALHESAPAGAKVAIMYSGGKDSSASLHYFVESLLARVAAGKSYITGVAITSSTQHEFAAMTERQEKEIAALNKWGKPYGFTAEIVTPSAKNTVMVELLGNGMALPPRAMNDKVAMASISNWCVMRVKSDLLDAAVDRAASVAPFVIQVLGSRYDESTSRSHTMNKYAAGMPPGLSRLKARDVDEADQRFIGMFAIGHFTGKTIRDFVHLRMTSYRALGNMELEQIYRDMSSAEGGEISECSIQRTADGSFGGGCSNLATGTRSGCQICLKSVNNALKHLAEKNAKRYALTYKLQQMINRHQDLVHARPKAVKATGLTSDQFFPKGFTFTERYTMLTILLAAEIVAGERQLSDEQLNWIERRWKRHGIFTVTTADARRDAQRWVDGGCKGEPDPFFTQFNEMAGEFTHSLGEGLSLGAYAAFSDPNQDDLNLAHLVSLGITGTPAFPRVLAYIFADRSNPGRFIIGVTDEPAVLGTRTNTGLINGMSGATLKCLGVRKPTDFEIKMADGRHIFYEISTTRTDKYIRELTQASETIAVGNAPDWSLEDFLEPKRMTGERLAAFELSMAATALESLNLARGSYCGIDFEPLTADYHQKEAIADLRGRLDAATFKDVYETIALQVELSDYLQDATESAHKSLFRDMEEKIAGDWGRLSRVDEEGKALRREIRTRLKKEMFGDPGQIAIYEAYITNLKAMARLYVADLLNTTLAVRIAFIVRTSYYCTEHAEEYMVDLLRMLQVKKGPEAAISRAV